MPPGGTVATVSTSESVRAVLAAARETAAAGRPVLINLIIGKTDFRKGAISM